MSITITLDPARHDLDAIHRILAGTYWSPGIRRDVVAEALRNSLVAVATLDATGETIGLARAVTDRATFAWLCDVFVDERFRGRGLARRLIAELEGHPSVATVRRWCLVTRDAEELYAKLGYARIPPARIWMERQGPKERWQEAGPATGPDAPG